MGIDYINKKIRKVAVKPRYVNYLLAITFSLVFLNAFWAVYAEPVESIVKVIDGDTVILSNGDKVRLLGINAPEVGYNGSVSDEGGVKAKTFLKNLILNKRVQIERDVELEDRYGRRLAHLFLENGLHINLEILRQGYATVAIHPPNLKYVDNFIRAQSVAEERGLGIWSLDAYEVRNVALIKARQSGQWGRVSGKVGGLTRLKKGAKLWLDDDFYVWISRKNFPYFQSIENYRGRDIEVRGWPKKRGRYWSINVIHSSQILDQP